MACGSRIVWVCLLLVDSASVSRVVEISCSRGNFYHSATICESNLFYFFFSSRRRHTRSLCDWSSDVCSSDLRRVGRSGDSRRKTEPQQNRDQYEARSTSSPPARNVLEPQPHDAGLPAGTPAV